jgi:Holliday junction resolvase-like predicted endonuclease
MDIIKEKIDKCADFLHKNGYEIVDLCSRPCKRDQRLAIDIVAYDRDTETIVMVLVRTHKNRDLKTRMMNCYKIRALQKIRKAGRCWVQAQKWNGKVRIDLIDIYDDGSIDHVQKCAPWGIDGKTEI